LTHPLAFPLTGSLGKQADDLALNWQGLMAPGQIRDSAKNTGEGRTLKVGNELPWP
jgi:hypothetical protein